MTIINPNSIAGITSLTAEAGVMNFYKSDGTLAGLQLNGVNFNTTSGISTFNNVYVGGTITYEDVKNIDSVGIITAREGIFLPDNKKVQLGNVAGTADFEIAHDTTNTVLQNRTGALYLKGIGGSGNNIIIEAKNNENSARFIPDGAVELYHNNSLKVSTTASGARVHDQLQVDGTIFAAVGLKVNADNQKIRVGAGDDLEIFHDGTDSYVKNITNDLILQSTSDDVIIRSNDDIHIQCTSNSDYAIKCIGDGAVELYHNAVKTFETRSDGAALPADDQKLKFGASNELIIYHHNNNWSYINHSGSGNLGIESVNNIVLRNTNGEVYIDCKEDGSVDLYNNNAIRLETTGSGVNITGDVVSSNWFKNSAAGEGLHNTTTNMKFYSNASNDTHLYHAANAQIKLSFRGSGDVFRGAVSADATGMHLLTAGSSEQKGVRCITNGATELYHSGTLKCETQSWGVEVHGGKVEIKGTEGGEAQLLLAADEGDDNDDVWRMIAHTNNLMEFGNTHGGTWETNAKFEGGGSCYFYENNIRKMRTVSDGIQVEGGEGQHAIVTLMADEGDDAASDYWRMVAETDATFRIEQYSGSAWVKHLQVSNSWVNLESVEGNQGSATLKLKKNSAASNVQSTMITFEVGNQGRGKIVSAHSDGSSPQFSSWSDRRLKTNFRNYTGGYDKIKAIPVKLYDEVRTGVKDRVGWIADEFQTVFPEAVEGTKDAVDSDGNPEYQSIAQGTIFPDVVQALQAAIAKIEVLEAEVAALKSA